MAIRTNWSLIVATTCGFFLSATHLAVAQVDATFSDDQPTARRQLLRLEDLESMALQLNPTLAQAAAEIQAAQGRTLQAGLYPNPTVGYSGEEIGAEDSAGQQGLFVDQMIVTGGKLSLKQNQVSFEIEKARHQAAAQQYRVLNAVRIQFFEVLSRQQLVDVRRGLFEITQEAVTTTEELLNVGQANKPDLLQARAESRRTHIALQAAKAELDAAWKKLAATVGDANLTPVPLDGSLEVARPPLEWSAALGRLLETSPEIQMCLAEIDRARWAVRRQQAEPIPDIQLRAGAQYNFETNDPQAEFEIGFRLPLFDANQGSIQAVCAELARANADLTRVELLLRQRLATAFAEYQTAQSTAEEYRTSILPDTREAYELYLESFRQHRAAWPQVLIAQRNYADASVEFIETLARLRQLEVTIDGLLLDDANTDPRDHEPSR